MTADPRGGRVWARLRDQVVREEPICQLQLPGICTHWSETADHIEPVATHPELGRVRSNLRGACRACNWERGKRPTHDLPGHAHAEDLLGFFD